MNSRYFFVEDLQKCHHITTEHYVTDEMIGDSFTKPVGGAKFRRFCNIIKNVIHAEYRPVEIDKLIAIHSENKEKKVQRGTGRQR